MSLRLKKMKELAVKEATNLKKHATKQEIDNLNLFTFDPTSESRCIYGQMTGECYSERSVELIQKCCTRVYNVKPAVCVRDQKLNGAPTAIDEDKHRGAFYHSPIEVLIWPGNGGKESGEKIIKFLKGETKELVL